MLICQWYLKNFLIKSLEKAPHFQTARLSTFKFWQPPAPDKRRCQHFLLLQELTDLIPLRNLPIQCGCCQLDFLREDEEAILKRQERDQINLVVCSFLHWQWIIEIPGNNVKRSFRKMAKVSSKHLKIKKYNFILLLWWFVSHFTQPYSVGTLLTFSYPSTK